MACAFFFDTDSLRSSCDTEIWLRIISAGTRLSVAKKTWSHLSGTVQLVLSEDLLNNRLVGPVNGPGLSWACDKNIYHEYIYRVNKYESLSTFHVVKKLYTSSNENFSEINIFSCNIWYNFGLKQYVQSYSSHTVWIRMFSYCFFIRSIFRMIFELFRLNMPQAKTSFKFLAEKSKKNLLLVLFSGLLVLENVP